MLIGGLHIRQMARLKRAHVARDEILVDRSGRRRSYEADHRQRGSERAEDSATDPAAPAVVVCRFGSKLGMSPNPCRKRLRSRMTDALPAQQIAHRLKPIELSAAAFAARHMRFDERRVRGVELAVDEPAEKQFLVNARRHLLHTP